jgi:hypothetical protein
MVSLLGGKTILAATIFQREENIGSKNDFIFPPLLLFFKNMLLLHPQKSKKS